MQGSWLYLCYTHEISYAQTVKQIRHFDVNTEISLQLVGKFNRSEGIQAVGSERLMNIHLRLLNPRPPCYFRGQPDHRGARFLGILLNWNVGSLWREPIRLLSLTPFLYDA